MRTTYWPTGEKRQEQGAGTYTASYAYTDQGQLKSLTTEAGDTHWQYDLAGNLQRKTYLDGNHTDYEYTPGGKLQATHQRPRNRHFSYRYNAANELEHVEYSDDSTASITYGYNRLGQNRNVVHGNTTYLNEYSDEGALIRQLISGGPLHGTILEQQFDDQGRRTQFKAGLPHNQNIVHSYGYDDRGRMASVRQNDRSAHYSYDDQTGALVSTRFDTAGQPIAETAREFDDLGRLTHISTRSLKEHGDFHQSFDYTYNDTNQRTRVETEDGSYWDYRYDDLGQVISAKRHWKDGTPVAGQQFEYDFDGIGNRNAARYGGDGSGKNLAEIRYTNSDDDATQIGTIEHPGTTYVTGTANEGAEVTVNRQPTERQGTYFSHPLNVDNSAGALIESIRINAREGAETDTQSRKAFVPARTAHFRYDPDGNLLFDGRWHYGWNGENRLIEMRSADVKGGRHLKLEFSYDHLGRRISKRVTETIDGHQPTATLRHFLYDGWNLVAELDATGRTHRTHLWGLDLSGTQQGAGGVGGLISTAAATTDSAIFISFDGNGNVTGELESDFGRTVTTASYDAFGNVATQTGESVSSFTFSTKFLDSETDQPYYGFRYYSAFYGKWLSRDPIDEQGGLNLYGFIENDGPNKWDFLGWKPDREALCNCLEIYSRLTRYNATRTARNTIDVKPGNDLPFDDTYKNDLEVDFRVYIDTRKKGCEICKKEHEAEYGNENARIRLLVEFKRSGHKDWTTQNYRRQADGTVPIYGRDDGFRLGGNSATHWAPAAWTAPTGHAGIGGKVRVSMTVDGKDCKEAIWQVKSPEDVSLPKKPSIFKNLF